MKLHYSLRECKKCGGLLEEPAASATVVCHSCGAEAQFLLFPSLSRANPAGVIGETVSSQEDAVCFFHAGKRAAAACDSCGRFLCQLCRLEWGSRILCPTCISAAEKNSDLVTRSRTLDDSIALGIGGFSFLLYFISFLIAPVTLVFAIRSFRTKGSLVRRNRIRAWIAIVFALLQIGGTAWFVFYVLIRSKV